MSRFIIAAAMWVSMAASAFPQTNQATITGTVTDAQGGSVPGASVTATDHATGIKTSSVTTGAGLYTLPNLPIGTYTVTVEHPGFRRSVREGITLTTGQTLGLDLKLEIGSVAESIDVKADAALIETRTSDVDQLVESKSIEDIPLADRRTMNIINMAAGAVFLGYDGNAKPNFSLSGGRTQSQMFWIDGSTGQNIRMGIGQMDMDPPIDAVSEIKVVSNNYSAEYGGTNSGVIVETTKSGTNQLHGSAFEYLRNNIFDAPGFFAPVQGGQKVSPELRYNVFGATAGGPIRRNKVFFFFAYQGQRRRTGAVDTLTVPTLLQRSGDFSQTFGANGAVVPIYDPAATTIANGQATRQRFPGNVIPSSRFDPVAVKLLPFYPAPNRAPDNLTGVNDFRANYVTAFNGDFHEPKIDYNINENNKITGRYLYNSGNNAETSVYPNPASDPRTFPLQHEHNMYADYTRVVTPTAINDLRFTFDTRYYHLESGGLGQNYAGKLGLNGLADTAFPQFIVTGFSGLGAALQERRQFPIDQYQFVDNYSWTRGKHSMKFGYEARRSRDHEITAPTPSGTFTFSPLSTGMPGVAASGSALAALLVGVPNAFAQNVTDELDRHSWYFAAFAQDDWSVRRDLTLNLGLRWETDTPMVDANHRMNGFDAHAINPVSGTPGVVKFMGVNGFRSTPYNADWNNFGPRFGFAWKPRGSSSTVVRGGFGVFFAEPFDAADPATAALGFSTSVAVNSPDQGLSFPFTLQSFKALTSTAPALNDSFGAVKVGQSTATAVTYFDPTRRTGYSLQFNLGVQRQLRGDIVVGAMFLGNDGRKLPNANLPIDQIVPQVLGPGHSSQAERPYPQFTNVTILGPTLGISNYYAGMLRVEKRFSHGLNFGASYARSKFLDNTFEAGATEGANNGPYSNYYNRRPDYGYSANDIPNRFSFNSVYELPFGPGKPWLARGFLGVLAGGWSLSNVTTLQSGPPVTAITQVNNCNCFSAGAQRPNVSANPNLGQRSVARWFNTSVFSQPAVYTFGNEGMGIIRADGLINFDFSLQRNFAVSERAHLQFRGEFFNSFNHTNLGLPGTALGGPAFGVVSSAGPARQIEIGARLSF